MHRLCILRTLNDGMSQLAASTAANSGGDLGTVLGHVRVFHVAQFTDEVDRNLGTFFRGMGVLGTAEFAEEH